MEKKPYAKFLPKTFQFLNSFLPAFFFCFFIITSSAASIRYSKESGALILSGFPNDAPATLSALYEADQANGWGVVQALKAGSKYLVNASIWIGDDAEDPATLVIGAQTPEYLELRGDLWVRPHNESGENRLTVGDPSKPEARSTLAFHCGFPQEFGLLVGSRKNGKTTRGGELFLYHTDVIPLAETLRGGFSNVGKTNGMYAARAELAGTRFKGIGARAMYGLNNRNAVIRDCVFEECETVFSLGEVLLEGCRFIGNVTVIDRTSGTFIDCIFEANSNDFVLSENRIVWIDSGKDSLKRPPVTAKILENPPVQDKSPFLIDYRTADLLLRNLDDTPAAGTRIRVESLPNSPFSSEGPVEIITKENGRISTDIEQDALLLARSLFYFDTDGETIIKVPVRHSLVLEKADGAIYYLTLDEKNMSIPGPIEIIF